MTSDCHGGCGSNEGPPPRRSPFVLDYAAIMRVRERRRQRQPHNHPLCDVGSSGALELAPAARDPPRFFEAHPQVPARARDFGSDSLFHFSNFAGHRHTSPRAERVRARVGAPRGSGISHMVSHTRLRQQAATGAVSSAAHAVGVRGAGRSRLVHHAGRAHDATGQQQQQVWRDDDDSLDQAILQAVLHQSSMEGCPAQWAADAGAAATPVVAAAAAGAARGHGGGGGHGGDGGSFDLSYEELSRLADVPTPLEPHLKRLIPVYQLAASDVEFREVNGVSECPICLMAYAEGDEVAMLPVCAHEFHSACIFHWFESQKRCCVCRKGFDELGRQ